MASFPPLYAIAHAIAGDDAYVLCLNSSAGPHKGTDSPVDMVKFNKAHLVLANGLELDEVGLKKLRLGSSNRQVEIFEVGNALPHAMLIHPEHADDGGDGHDHDHGDHDPHVWLGPPEVILMADLVAKKLGSLDPAKGAAYAKRAQAFKDEVRALHAEGKKLLEGKKNRGLVTTHESLAYLARALDLEIVGSIQATQGNDPDSARLAKLCKLCTTKDVRVLAVEPGSNPNVAKTMQSQLKAQQHELRIVKVDPLETAVVPAGQVNPEAADYLRKMRANIQALADALP